MLKGYGNLTWETLKKRPRKDFTAYRKRGIVKTKQKEIFRISKKLVKSKNLWERRFAIVLLINFTKDESLTNEIREIIKNVESDKEYYVQKAVEWVKKKLE
ncbi:MAG: DNA alkylation repair protein [Candidatus Aenigmatarchaeota archaeon]|nr:DNA alkylation repair protein [Candidatus Aenigmarchaeota archaeon]